MGHARHEFGCFMRSLHVVEVLLQPRKLVVPGGLGGHALGAAGRRRCGMVWCSASTLRPVSRRKNQVLTSASDSAEQADDQAGRGQRGPRCRAVRAQISPAPAWRRRQQVGEQLRGDAPGYPEPPGARMRRSAPAVAVPARPGCRRGSGHRAWWEHQLQIRVAPVPACGRWPGRGPGLMGVLQSQALLRLLQLPFQVAGAAPWTPADTPAPAWSAWSAAPESRTAPPAAGRRCATGAAAARPRGASVWLMPPPSACRPMQPTPRTVCISGVRPAPAAFAAGG